MSNGKILNGALSAYTISSNVLNVLRNPSILQIGFELNGLGVTGTRYSVVADAIYEGKISCEVVHQFKLQPGETLEPGTSIAASYHPPGNTMYFPSESFGEVNAGEQAAILHEATHAIFDLYAPTNEYRVLKIDDETAAVLAQAFYFRLCVRSGVGAETDFKSTRHGDLALQIADRIIAERGGFDRGKGTFFLRDKRMYFLRPQQTASLRDAVARHWELIKKHDAAGRPTDSSGTLSIYDGVVNCIWCLGHQK